MEYQVTTELAKTENNDCVVRAIMVATGMAYRQCHAFAEEFLGRVQGQGVKNMPLKFVRTDVVDRFRELGYVVEPHNTKYVRAYGNRTLDMNVRRFSKTYPKGTFIVANRTHAWVIKDGVVHDWDGFKPKLQRTCMFAWKVTSNRQLEFQFPA